MYAILWPLGDVPGPQGEPYFSHNKRTMDRAMGPFGCVNGIATLFQDSYAGVCGVVLDCDDHGVLGADRRFVGGGRLGICLGRESGGEQS